ncbi:Asp-tRNA(Asn)/Glu-tRNA(Gln) amidotransferase subunit GatA [Canibacter sp. lx-72]|uniref:Asp-tRNA(Asn)/Glu-tRNA(Gln) amidotransferase subunit GatA n=1 Tax=Canibacter zhuwentaonis TaxID=2837491 RepID=UPI001BDBE245|nr:Asp-tRNA(Asn)/Glu-tRNA(Gln) amidotransferase subunit GatA [Canibacter zhuwentaonis]MBT1017775.1 Asp-tRNA(Asn)/Glu-tRNA(Gln) amidotransferase subunit GatA [Canibacter zhuwentaonis]
MSAEYTKLTAAELAAGLAAGDFSAAEVTAAHLAQIEATNDTLNSFLCTNDAALETARKIDERRAAGEQLAELAGVPLAVKDVLVTTDMPSTSGSKILAGYMSPFDATVVAKARRAGLVLLGKTNMDEFAMGSSNENSAYGSVKNPWQTDCVPGGSGGGSAAAVAAFQAPLALGSDTGGSIRQPAALTGSVGVKPTYGAVSRYGAIAMASSLDQIGPCARTVLDAGLLQDVIAGHDWHDATSLRHDWVSMAQAAREGAATGSLKGVKIGVVKELISESHTQTGVLQNFNAALELAAREGAEIVPITAKHFEYAVAAYYLIMPAEVSSNLARYDSVRFGMRVDAASGDTVADVMSKTRAAGFGSEVKRRIILGTYALSAGYYDAYYGTAQRVRTLVQRDFNEAFAQVDVLAAPTSNTTAWHLGERTADPMQNYLNDATTIPANLAGVPGISVPIGLAAEDNMPVGLQLMAPQYEDARLYKTGAAFERLIAARDGKMFWQRMPALQSVKAGA